MKIHEARKLVAKWKRWSVERLDFVVIKLSRSRAEMSIKVCGDEPHFVTGRKQFEQLGWFSWLRSPESALRRRERARQLF